MLLEPDHFDVLVHRRLLLLLMMMLLIVGIDVPLLAIVIVLLLLILIVRMMLVLLVSHCGDVRRVFVVEMGTSLIPLGYDVEICSECTQNNSVLNHEQLFR